MIDTATGTSRVNQDRFKLLRANPRVTSSLFLLVLVASLAPTLLSYTPYSMAWDDLYFFHRTISLNRALWHLDPHQFSETFSILMKSPVMALMSFPWGPQIGTSELSIGTALVSLSTLNWLFVLLCIYVVDRVSKNRLLVIFAALSVASNPVMRGYAGAFLADGLVSWTILLLLLLVPYEALTEEGGAIEADIKRGILWGLTLSVGVLAKVTFGYFVLLAVPALLWFRMKNQGNRRTLITVGVAAILCLPSSLIWILYGKQFLAHAVASSTGDMAEYYRRPGETVGGFIIYYFKLLGAAFYLQIALVVTVVVGILRKRRLSVPVLYSLLVLCGYFLIASMSPDRDERYFMPVMVGFPILLSVMSGGRPARDRNASMPPILPGVALVCTFCVSLPMMSRPVLTNVHYAMAVLNQCRAEGLKRFTIATDSPALNVETFLLAKELLGPAGQTFDIGTLAYDVMHKKPLDESIRTMKSSQVVAFEQPFPNYPDFTNSRDENYASYASEHGEKLPDPAGGRLLLYTRIR